MTTGRRKSERSTRRKLSSPGRPPVWQREHLCRFWRGIAAGLSSEEAGVEAGVSGPVGSRWFRSSGGMPPTHLAASAPLLKSRNLSFAKRRHLCIRKSGSKIPSNSRSAPTSCRTLASRRTRVTAPIFSPRGRNKPRMTCSLAVTALTAALCGATILMRSARQSG